MLEKTMLPLQEEFSKQVLPPSEGRNSAHESDTQSDAESIETLTYEYEDNPFTSFMKQLETLMDTDPQEALRLVKLALSDQMFDRKAQIKKLTETLDTAIDLVQQEKEYGLSALQRNSPGLAKDFFKTVWNLPEIKPEKAPAAAAPSPMMNGPSYQPLAA